MNSEQVRSLTNIVGEDMSTLGLCRSILRQDAQLKRVTELLAAAILERNELRRELTATRAKLTRARKATDVDGLRKRLAFVEAQNVALLKRCTVLSRGAA